MAICYVQKKTEKWNRKKKNQNILKKRSSEKKA